MSYRTIISNLAEYDVIEAELEGACLPGELLEWTSDGKLQVHSTAGGPAAVIVAIEDYTQGKEVTDAYSDGNQVLAVAPHKGETIIVRLADIDSSVHATVTEGDFLESNGDGTVRRWTSPSSVSANNINPLFVALETLDMSDSSGVHGSGLIKAQVL